MNRTSRSPCFQIRVVARVLLFWSCFAAAGSVSAQTIWTAGTGNWNTPGNWTLGVPIAPGDAVIENDGTAQLLTPGGSVRRLRVGRAAGGGNLQVNGGTLVVTDDLHLNEGSAGPASMIVQGGSTVTAPDTVIGFSSGFDTSFQISGGGTVYNATTSFTVGRAGAGAASLTVDGGAVLASGTGSIGTFAGSSGSAEVVGAGSWWSNTGDFFVGNSGVGNLVVSGGGKLSNNGANIGLGAGSSGVATVDGAGSHWFNSSVLAVGVLGNGALNITGGGEVSSTSGRIGRELGGTGAVTVSGPGSRWFANGDLTVGGGVGGVGTLTIADQATVYVENNVSINSLSNVNLNGGTLRLHTANGLNRLNYNSGTIHLSERTIGGGDAIISTLFGTGPSLRTIPLGKRLVVEGISPIAGQLNIDGGKLQTAVLLVGHQNFQVKMRITNGGTVNSSSGANIGGGDSVNPIGQGEVVVSGAGSTWTASHMNVGSQIPIGDAGDTTFSTLTIEDQGLVHMDDVLGLGALLIQPQGIVNLNGGTLRLNRFDLVVRPGHRVGQFNFNAGTIQFAGDRTIGDDETITEMLGGAPTLTLGKAMTVEGAATLNTSVTIDGGTFSAAQLVNGQNVGLQRGTLNITNQAVTIGASGPLGDALDVNDDMTVNVTLGITNQGLVTGDGEIGGTFANAAGGELRGDPGKSLMLTGAGNTNAGRVNLLGGAVEFTRDLTNNAGGFISGNGSLLAGGLTNHGTMNFAGTANIVGDVANAAGGKIISGGGGATIFFDDVTNDGEIRTSTNGFTVFFGDVDGAGTFTGTGTVNFEGDLNPGNSAAAVSFSGDVVFGPEATLQIELGGAAPGEYDQIQVAGELTLGGALELSLIDGFTPSAGQTFDILNWGSLTGAFSSVVVPSQDGLTWDTSQLSTGMISVAVTGLPGDYNQNGVVDAADYTVWRDTLGSSTNLTADGDGSNTIDAGDRTVWQANFGATLGSGANEAAAVPEPAPLVLLALGGLFAVFVFVRHNEPRLAVHRTRAALVV